MGLLEDAIREHLDLKRSRGADPTEIERLEREALGPVRREPVGGADRIDMAAADYGSNEPSPIEYHDSTAPRWQQDEDFGEHHGDLVPVEAPEPEPGKRRGFLRRSRGAEPAREPEPMPEPDAALGWPERDEPAADFAEEHFGLAHAVPDEAHFDESRFDVLDHVEHLTPEHLAPGPRAEDDFDDPELAADEFVEHPQAGGRFEPDYSPPTEVYQPVDLPVEEDDAPSAYSEVDRMVPPASAAPTPRAGAHHPILDDLPFYEPATNGDGQAVEEPIQPTPAFEAETATAFTPVPAQEPESVREREPAQEPQSGVREAPSTEAEGDHPPQLQFDRPPKRPSFSAEPPGLGGSDNGAPKRPSGQKSGRAKDELQGTLEFDVDGGAGGADADEDVLEVTPDFLQDTPEHDRLWFEQAPPKDFDFDG